MARLDPRLRPMLRPGTQVLRRDLANWQVGTCQGIVVPDEPGVRDVLQLCDGARTVAAIRRLSSAVCPDPDAVIARLLAAGALVSASRSRPRPVPCVAVTASPGTAEAVALLTAMLADRVKLTSSAVAPDLRVVVHAGEPPRGLFEDWAVRQEAHALLVFDGQHARVGPFVIPGHSPCVGCYDSCRAEWEPSWPVLVSQLGDDPPTVGVGRATLARACAELAGDVLAVTDGALPATAGATITLGPGRRPPIREPFGFHHACGCGLLAA